MGRILVVDDEKSIRVTLREFLIDAGHTVSVAEDARVFLISWRVAGDLAQVEVVAGVGRLLEHDPVTGEQAFLHSLQGLFSVSLRYTDPGHAADPLGFDKDLALFTEVRADLLTCIVVGAKEP